MSAWYFLRGEEKREGDAQGEQRDGEREEDLDDGEERTFVISQTCPPTTTQQSSFVACFSTSDIGINPSP